MLRKMVSAMSRERNGMALLPVAIVVAAVGLLVYPVLRWYFSMIQGTANLEDKLEMQIITQEYLGRINAATYDEIVQTVAAKGSSWTEDVRDGKYEAKIEVGEDGKFADAKCGTEAAIGDGDKRCRTATITVTSKLDPSQVMKLSTISIATVGQIPEIQRRLSVQDDRFSEYYTKGEGDGHFACPWDYRLTASGCVPCNAPTWKQYRNGNCSLYTCPTGQKANATGNGCEQIVCPTGKELQGDYCVDPMRFNNSYCFTLGAAGVYSWKITGCAKDYCPGGSGYVNAGYWCVMKAYQTGRGWMVQIHDPRYNSSYYDGMGGNCVCEGTYMTLRISSATTAISSNFYAGGAPQIAY